MIPMDDLSSKQFLFIVGAPRSGTTWLFEMLSEHPSVVSLKKELTLFLQLSRRTCEAL